MNLTVKTFPNLDLVTSFDSFQPRRSFYGTIHLILTTEEPSDVELKVQLTTEYVDRVTRPALIDGDENDAYTNFCNTCRANNNPVSLDLAWVQINEFIVRYNEKTKANKEKAEAEEQARQMALAKRHIDELKKFFPEIDTDGSLWKIDTTSTRGDRIYLKYDKYLTFILINDETYLSPKWRLNCNVTDYSNFYDLKKSKRMKSIVETIKEQYPEYLERAKAEEEKIRVQKLVNDTMTKAGWKADYGDNWEKEKESGTFRCTVHFENNQVLITRMIRTVYNLKLKPHEIDHCLFE